MPAKKKSETTSVPAPEQESSHQKQDIEKGSQSHDHATFDPKAMELTLVDNDVTGESWEGQRVVSVRYPSKEERTTIQGKKANWQSRLIAVGDPTQETLGAKPEKEMDENEKRAAEELKEFETSFKKAPAIPFQWVVTDALNGIMLYQACYPRTIAQRVMSIGNSVRHQQCGGTTKMSTKVETKKASNGATAPAAASSDGGPE